MSLYHFNLNKKDRTIFNLVGLHFLVSSISQFHLFFLDCLHPSYGDHGVVAAERAKKPKKGLWVQRLTRRRKYLVEYA